MRIIYFVISLLLTVALIIGLDNPIGSIPPLGSFVSPQHGFWQNAEPADKDFNADITLPGIKNKAIVYFDERLVPHLFAEEEEDAFFIQGYLHAKFRLWQMEFQTHVAAGRLSEVLGAGTDSAYLNNDRNMRRLGMVYGAKKSLETMERDPVIRSILNAYTQGVNSYIAQLTVSTLPLEYRLLHYYPEKWTNLKTALFLKYMSFDLTGNENDIEYTNAKSFFSEEDFNKLYPLIQDSLYPVIPKGTVFDAPAVKPAAPASADSLYFQWKDSARIHTVKTDKDNGSNNWVAAGTKTRSGRPILCNDPHLGLNLPSLWYEMQITTKSINAYGVSFPGAPAIIIGFNDSIAWGVTNAARDVRDYYRIQFKDASQTEYFFNGEWKKATLQTEDYLIRGGEAFRETVAYTVFGPVMYDQHYSGGGRLSHAESLAVQWKAQEGSNELKTFYLLNRSANYQDYLAAIRDFKCPGQNFVFAGKNGDIAIWQQGEFPAKWKRQGDFIMPGTDSSYTWRESVPQQENPHLLNPAHGFVSSANQKPADTTYPYYLGGSYDVYRGLIINRFLSGMEDITISDMQRLQTNNYNVFAETALPFLFKHLKENELDAEDRKYLAIVKQWNWFNDPEEKGPTIFTTWFELLEQFIWNDELAQAPAPVIKPEPYTLIDALKKDSAFSFIDNINTPELESLEDRVTQAFRKAVAYLAAKEGEGSLAWGKYKDTGIRHLLRLEPLSRFHINAGGGLNIINATKQYQGPSWRMIVQLTDKTEAFGVYPGGQSGNPGSRYYDNFIEDWTAGKYYNLWFMEAQEQDDKRIRFVMKFGKDG